MLFRSNAADTTWLLVSTALVLLMTPALAFFYGGLVRSKNVLNTMMMSVISLGFVSVLWAVIGYSLAFGEGNAWIGSLDKAFLRGVGSDLAPIVTAKDEFVRIGLMDNAVDAILTTDQGKAQFITQALKVERFFQAILDRKSTRLNSSHSQQSRMPSSA